MVARKNGDFNTNVTVFIWVDDAASSTTWVHRPPSTGIDRRRRWRVFCGTPNSTDQYQRLSSRARQQKRLRQRSTRRPPRGRVTYFVIE